MITNARKSWVTFSANFFLPQTHSILIQDGVELISARDAYEIESLPFDSWKNRIFLTIGEETGRSRGQLIVIGDSYLEIDAGHALVRQL